MTRLSENYIRIMMKKQTIRMALCQIDYKVPSRMPEARSHLKENSCNSFKLHFTSKCLASAIVKEK